MAGKKSRRNRPRPSARKKPFKDPEKRILIVTEGKVTEPESLKGLKDAVKNPLVDIEVVGGAGVPRRLLKRQEI
jgi:hypothetical protein